MINNVVLVGRLTKDPEMRYTSNNFAFIRFVLAVERYFKNKEGNREADFISCIIWRKSAEILQKYTKKGSMIGIIGRIQTGSYENNNNQRIFTTEIVCERIQLLQSKNFENIKKEETFNKNNKTEKIENLFENNDEEIEKIKSDLFKNNDVKNENLKEETEENISDDDLPF